MSACAAIVSVIMGMSPLSDVEEHTIFFPECAPSPPVVCMQPFNHLPWQPPYLICLDEKDKIVFKGHLWFTQKEI